MALWSFCESGPNDLLLAAAFVVSISLVLNYIIAYLKIGKDSTFPRGPRAWPIVGHLPLLASGCPHRTFADLSRIHGYGPIIGLRLGGCKSVIICDASIARDVLMTHDQVFANRPRYSFIQILLYGHGTSVSFTCYGALFNRLRKIYTSELFSPSRLHELRHVREEEAHAMLRRLIHVSGVATQPVDLKAIFGEMSMKIMIRLLQSKKTGAATDGKEALLARLVEALVEDAKPIISDFLPWLKFVDILTKRRMMHVHDCFDELIDAIIQERKEATVDLPSDALPQDLLQVLLSKEAPSNWRNETGSEEFLTIQQIKGIILDILTAGTHTTSLTLEWTMAELLRNPRCFNKVRDEVEAVMVNSKLTGPLIMDEGTCKLPYLELVVKEVMRLHPVVPLLLPRISGEECKLGKYILPKDTQVFVNVWQLGRDPNLWGEEAEKFIPERFAKKEMDLKGQNFGLLPFGSGRRMCPGMRLGLSLVQMTIANLVRVFDWELPHGQLIDMEEKRGISNGKGTPLLAIPKLRSSDIQV
ncbi:hypothetical protein KP509_20G029900 [Ceratopteris richardii]|uniref:Cytochrome P450 n=1 Tax=Ceratopteris richardii TaxID=49495 RepID=A0A8T2SH63_CERRI|nr:hypothetical protein KP509_20G029900 [Ceratopteris richardii]